LRKNLRYDSFMPSMSAEYWRNRRKVQKTLNKGAEHQAGVREGIALCVKFCREIVAGRAYTGFQIAVQLDKGLIGAETAEAQQRRAMVEGMR
jgi:hypothetical protein